MPAPQNMKQDQQGKILFVPLELPDPKQIRNSFKSLLKTCLPVDLPPATQETQQQQHQGVGGGYLKDVEDSGWLEQVS